MITIEQIRKLNAERTQSDWINGTHPANHKLNIIKPIVFGNRIDKLPECEGGHAYFKNKADADFIAACPDIAAYAIEMHEKAERFERALKTIRDELLLTELNMLNYTEDDISELNDESIQAFKCADRALKGGLVLSKQEAI